MIAIDSLHIQISIDRGGTFTDVHAAIPSREDIVIKLLSVDPSNYQDAPTEGIRRVLELATGVPHPRGEPLDLHHVNSIRMGTTVATNALLERKGTRLALLITKGFKDLLVIGNQSRPKIFDLSISRPDVLYDQVVEVDERVTMEDYTEDPNFADRPLDVDHDDDLEMATTGERIRVLKKLDVEQVQNCLQRLWDEGYQSIAVVFVHSYAFPKHENLVGELATKMGFSVALSSALQPMIKVVPRGMSATADAYLTPVIKDYIESVSANFKGGLEKQKTRCDFMQSNGGLVDYRKFSGLNSILSGPAGGVVGYAQTSWDEEERCPVIGFDMGGTSTDVSRFAGTYEHVFETVTAGVAIQSPQLDINTVAAGGGSILSWRNGLFNVGPESASAHPGPACYRKGGPLTVTDANLFLGRLLPDYFPKIFGPKEDEPLDQEVTGKKFEELTAHINDLQRQNGGSFFTPEEVALGFLRVADEGMARPIRALTEARGFDTSSHQLACFGGAGGQHACSVASVLSISRVIIHKYSSILSAYGMSLADVVHETQRPAATTYSEETKTLIWQELEAAAEDASSELRDQGFTKDQISFSLYLNMRYAGSSGSQMVLKGESQDFKTEFEKLHKREFGFLFEEKDIWVDDIRVRAVGKAKSKSEMSPYQQMKIASAISVAAPSTTASSRLYFDGQGFVDTPVFQFKALPMGSAISGPALLIDNTQTIIVSPGATAKILETCVIIDLEKSPSNAETNETPQSEVSPIQLSIFGHRFMSIAEQMGRTLQKTAVSTNIKERLDFSCAIFSPDGGLVANAPHVPVHLGSMQFAVRYQHKLWAGKLQDGDALVSNHPACGGTHLPDITVITPVFDGEEIIFYVASRGHHADIGGMLPGSMPPTSTELWQEGAAIEAEKLLSAGRFNEEVMTRLLLVEPARYHGCSGTRKLADNISDLKAQVAANVKGISLLKALIAEFSLQTVHKNMYAIQKTAEIAVRDLLKSKYEQFGGQPLEAVDYMDDGTPIALRVIISPNGSAVFDFEGTGPQVYGNTNAPIAITHSAIIYCLRSLIASDVPLNQGCLNPIDIRVPESSILSPSKDCGVVGGNVLTSQRITDVVLLAFQACAASQGCTNNLTFGTGGKDDHGNHIEGFGYYETIAGGSGAGPSWIGQSGVHTHMTNTRITDPEVFEKRYPCILREFGLRHGSGGKGLHDGGNGTVRDIEFREAVQCSILSERRSRQPYGLDGGGEGASGVNLVLAMDQQSGQRRVKNLGGKATIKLQAGDRIIVKTPGGGAWGAIDANIQERNGSAGSMNAKVGEFSTGSVDAYKSKQETN